MNDLSRGYVHHGIESPIPHSRIVGGTEARLLERILHMLLLGKQKAKRIGSVSHHCSLLPKSRSKVKEIFDGGFVVSSEQQMPGFQVGLVFVALAMWGQGDVSVEAGGDSGGEDAPEVEGDDLGGHHGNPGLNNVSFSPGKARYNRAKHRGY